MSGPLYGSLGLQAHESATALSAAADDIQTGSPAARLRQATLQPFQGSDVTFSQSESQLGQLRGYDNPYGRGLAAYEPNTVIFSDYATAKNAVDQSKADEAAAADQMASVDFTGIGTGAVLGQADGQVGTAVNAALDLAKRAVPYVWGGTTSNGVDCSGLIQYAFKSAGIDMPRYRAVDYGRMGVAVTVDQARPGDIVYYDESGDTDHVGLYIGNGLMVQSPQTGDHVRVTAIGKPTSIRRIFDDAKFSQVAMPDGSIGTGYNGRLFTPSTTAPVSQVSNPAAISAPTITRTGGTGFRTRAI